MLTDIKDTFKTEDEGWIRNLGSRDAAQKYLSQSLGSPFYPFPRAYSYLQLQGKSNLAETEV